MINIDAIRSGGEPAFAEAFGCYYAKVYHYLLKRTRNPAMAREVAQLTFIKLWEFRHTLSCDHSFDSQLFRMANGALIDHLRREDTRKRALVRAADVLAQEEAVAHGFEHDDYLRSLTRHLSPVRKKVFILSRIHGHSYKEIAEKLSISSKTVEDHMVKALRQIRQIASQLFVLAVFLLLTFILT